jgi:hypothetical protein
VRAEGNMSLKPPVTPPGIDPGTVQLVVRRLNNYATPGPKYKNDSVLIQILTYKIVSTNIMYNVKLRTVPSSDARSCSMELQQYSPS